ncbi:hypothetical protein JDV02_005975 [Purpureocillium takamizusanense]|uniref:C6 transcription factor n=1 Tax=Purpureocillium takamizusanense TaxID=2060973 RepID=A0A9Q8QHM6_9HYPO|nr:uncharacterized protein JDV02_005975 [Purpureocillium takamizusanense]UNI19825.1 hypothetical protein JDV02_005975 [Purpureocillium takamizusanense]
MASDSDVDAIFANTFVVGGDAESMQTLGIADHPRKKRAHRKSRRGCMACKRRRVKEEFVMSTVLCLAVTHLTALRPQQDAKYANASARLLSKSLRLLRQNLSRAFTKDTCNAIVGTAILVNYISWCHLDFLDGQRNDDADTALDLSRDQLILLSPGVLQVFFQALPVFVAEKSDFLTIVHQHPRLNIEDALRKRGVDPARFVQPFMAIYDDPNYQTRGPIRTEKTTSWADPSLHSWRFLMGLETELSSNDSTQHTDAERVANSLRVAAENSRARNGPVVEGKNRDIIVSSCGRSELSVLPPDDSVRTAYELVARRLSTLLSCALLPPVGDDDVHPTAVPSRADVQRFFFVFPILCSGTFAQMAVDGDARALVLLFHFYRAARTLLAGVGQGWWAAERSRVLEALLLRELESRGLSACLRDDGRDGELGSNWEAGHSCIELGRHPGEAGSSHRF